MNLAAVSFVLALVAHLPAVAAVQDRFVSNGVSPHQGETGLKPNSACASTDDPAQCAALVDLYNSAHGDKWENNTGWLSGSSYCEWFNGMATGAMCDRSGNVIHL